MAPWNAGLFRRFEVSSCAFLLIIYLIKGLSLILNYLYKYPSNANIDSSDSVCSVVAVIAFSILLVCFLFALSFLFPLSQCIFSLIPLGRLRRRLEDNIRIDLEEIGINAGNWVDSAQDRNYWRALVNAALNLRVP